MTRVGWIMLVLILLAGGAFASMVRIGGGDPERFPLRSPIPAEPTGTFASTSSSLLAVPVKGVRRSAIADNWGDSRGGGTRTHHGTDIMAAGGTPVLAAAPGRIEKLFQSRLGGTTLYLRSADRRWIYYYAHLAGYASGIHEGRQVRAGERLGFVGDTGDAGPGNYHLHFGVQRMSPGQRWWQGEDVNPYPLLAGRPPRR